MARGNVAPKADQPRVTTESLKRDAQPTNLQYRVQGVKSFDRSSKTRDLGRSVRGQLNWRFQMRKSHKKSRKSRR